MSATRIENVKYALGITGNYQDNTLTQYINFVVGYLEDAGVASANITDDIVAIGVGDLWHYGSNDGKLSTAFKERAIQLAYK